LARKLPVIVFIGVLLVYTLYPSVEAVRQVSIPSPVAETAPASYADEETVDFEVTAAPNAVGVGSDVPGDATKKTPAPNATPLLGDVVVRYTPTPSPTPAPTPVPTPEPTPLTLGMNSPDVALLQQKLQVLGFLVDKPDGIYGKGTQEAVKELQKYLNQVAATSGASATFEDERFYGDGVVEALSSGVATTEETPAPTPTPAPLYPVTGTVDAKLMQALSDGIPVYRETITTGSSGLDTQRVQRRLASMDYLYKGTDGVFGEKTAKGLTYFQKINGIPQTGIADEVTQKLLFSENAVPSDRPYHPYSIKVDVSEQRVYVYAWSGDGYKKLVKKFKCSTGLPSTPTPLGTYKESTGPGKRWHYFKKFSCWAQYAFYIQGDVMFHSVIYEKKGGRPTYGSVHNLGRRASHGCVRLAVKDAKWIWENVEAGTTVKVQK
jgi:peptidoglycan hydrolase-like protein with peptidoglycan-binding domain